MTRPYSTVEVRHAGERSAGASGSRAMIFRNRNIQAMHVTPEHPASREALTRLTMDRAEGCPRVRGAGQWCEMPPLPALLWVGRTSGFFPRRARSEAVAVGGLGKQNGTPLDEI